MLGCSGTVVTLGRDDTRGRPRRAAISGIATSGKRLDSLPALERLYEFDFVLDERAKRELDALEEGPRTGREPAKQP